MLQARDLVKTYGQGPKTVRALDGVSVSADAGQFTIIRGPSGCGKTTLLLSLGALLAPDSGQVELEGQDPYKLPPAQRAALRASRIGFVFQQFYLVPYLSVRENVLCAALGNSGTDTGFPKKSGVSPRISRADELIEQLNLTKRRDHVPNELSTGEKQRTALARAMLNRPPLLLADEPTGNLDQDNASAVIDALRAYAAAGAAVILVTHDPRWEDKGDRIVRMEYGKVVG